MIECAGAMVDFFTVDDRGFPAITPKCQSEINRIRADLQWRDPVMMPYLTEPPGWTGWWAEYDDRLRKPFVRNDWRPKTREMMQATFEAAKPPATASGPFAELADLKYSLPFAHADGVNALQRVPLRINQAIPPLVERFAVELMGYKGKVLEAYGRLLSGNPRKDDERLVDEARTANERTVRADLDDAKWIDDRRFFLTYNCDRRGRVFSIPHLSYLREDHVRGLLLFANGEPLGHHGLQWLEIHWANCEGSTDKDSWPERLNWARANRDKISSIAADPPGTFEYWRKAEDPFAFVAACLELDQAYQNPTGFVTHLPIGFDGTANGIQHLALLARDEEAAELVNLTGIDVGSVRYPSEAEYRSIPEPGHRAIRFRQAGEAFVAALAAKDNEQPRDVYKEVSRRVLAALRTKDDAISQAWYEYLHPLSETKLRKLFKGAVVIYPYSGTDAGMADKILDAHADMFKNYELQRTAALHLAKLTRKMCDEVLPGPARIMNYIRDLADHRRQQGRFLEWRSPTGFWIGNDYQFSSVKEVVLPVDGIRVKYSVADGANGKINVTKTLDASSPNFIHSLDAAHLVRVVLAANSAGIKDLLTAHDKFRRLAPNSQRLVQIIHREMILLYTVGDPLADLRRANMDDPNNLPLPKRGNLDIYGLQNGEYSFA